MSRADNAILRLLATSSKTHLRAPEIEARLHARGFKESFDVRARLFMLRQRGYVRALLPRVGALVLSYSATATGRQVLSK